MKKSRFPFAGIAVAISLLIGGQEAADCQGVIFNQNNLVGINNGAVSDSDPINDAYSADDFILNLNSTIQWVRWHGHYQNNLIPVADNFTFRFFNDAGGAPGTLITMAMPGNTVNRADTGFNLGLQDIHSYQAAVNLALGPGNYWLSIVNDTSATAAMDTWLWGRVNGGGNGVVDANNPLITTPMALNGIFSFQLLGQVRQNPPQQRQKAQRAVLASDLGAIQSATTTGVLIPQITRDLLQNIHRGVVGELANRKFRARAEWFARPIRLNTARPKEKTYNLRGRFAGTLNRSVNPIDLNLWLTNAYHGLVTLSGDVVGDAVSVQQFGRQIGKTRRVLEKLEEGFNPSDRVESRVSRLFYFRDAHRVAQIINRDPRSNNRAGDEDRNRRGGLLQLFDSKSKEEKLIEEYIKALQRLHGTVLSIKLPPIPDESDDENSEDERDTLIRFRNLKSDSEKKLEEHLKKLMKLQEELGMDELSDPDESKKVYRAKRIERFLSQPFFEEGKSLTNDLELIRQGWDYTLLNNDGSIGVHQPRFIEAILESDVSQSFNHRNPSDPNLLRYLDFAANQRIDHRVALGLAEGEEVEILDTLAAGEKTIWAGTPAAMLGGPVAITTMKAVIAVPEGSAKNPVDAKFVIEDAPADSRFEVFTAFDYGFYDQNNVTSVMRGFRSDSYTGTLGLEYQLAPGLRVGGAFSNLWSDTEAVANLGGIDLEGQLLSGYLTAVSGNTYFDFLYSYGDFDHEMRRNTLLGSTARGDTDSHSHNLALEVGRSFVLARDITGGPFAGLGYSTGDIDGYRETSGGSANLIYPDDNFESMIGRYGWQVTHYGKLGGNRVTTQFHAAWAHEFMPETDTVQASLATSPFLLVTGGGARRIGSFTAEGEAAHPGTDWLELGAGVQVDLGDSGAHLNIGYQGQFGRNNASAHFASAKLGYEW